MKKIGVIILYGMLLADISLHIFIKVVVNINVYF